MDRIIEVKQAQGKKEMADFVGLTGKLYADNSCYVPDLEMDIYDMFNPAKNAGLEFTEMCPMTRRKIRLAGSWEL